MNFTPFVDITIAQVLDGVETFINNIYARNIPEERVLLTGLYTVLGDKIARMAALARKCKPEDPRHSVIVRPPPGIAVPHYAISDNKITPMPLKSVNIGNVIVNVESSKVPRLGVITHDGTEFAVKLSFGAKTFDLRGNVFEILQMSDLKDNCAPNTIVANDFLYIPHILRHTRHLSRCHYGSRAHLAMDMSMMNEKAKCRYMLMAAHMLIAAAILAANQ